MRQTGELDDLRRTIEELREASYPRVPRDLLESILVTEEAMLGDRDRTERLRALQRLIEDCVARGDEG